MMRPTQRPEAPDVAQELLLLEDALGILCERDQELIFLGRQLYRRAPEGDDARSEVDLEIPDAQARVARSVRAPQDGPHPRHKLVVHERLGQYFVR